MDFEACDDGVMARLPLSALLQGYTGILHGGVIATVLDGAMTHCLFRKGISGLTGDLRIRYMRPVPARDEIVVKARIAQDMAPLYHLEAKLFWHETMMASGTARFLDRRAAGTRK